MAQNGSKGSNHSHAVLPISDSSFDKVVLPESTCPIIATFRFIDSMDDVVDVVIFRNTHTNFNDKSCCYDSFGLE